MKKVISLLVIFALALSVTPAYAAKGRRGASDTAYEHASDEAVFNRVGDWFATVGKSDEEKQAILTERKAKRAKERAEKEAKKAAKQAEKEAKKAKKKLKKQTRSMKQKRWGQS